MLKRSVFIFIILAAIVSSAYAEDKRADLAGMWYTSNAGRLKAELEKYLADAKVGKIEGDVIGLVAPHAGYSYSGPIAAYAFKAAMSKKPDKVIIVGFTHRRYFPGSSAGYRQEGTNCGG